MKSFVFAVATAAVALSVSTASAQSLNIDMNGFFGTPANTYGAALGQAGTWTTITNAGISSTPLLGLGGGATGASWNNVTGNALFNFDNAGTAGDDQALMDDGFDLGGAGAVDTFSITGLTNGSYNVAVYAWAPDSATFITGVSVNGSAVQNVGGAWGGSHQAGVTYALVQNVLIANGTISINTNTVSGFSTLNGVQITLIPAPGALAMLGLAGLVGSRRRRA